MNLCNIENAHRRVANDSKAVATRLSDVAAAKEENVQLTKFESFQARNTVQTINDQLGIVRSKVGNTSVSSKKARHSAGTLLARTRRICRS